MQADELSKLRRKVEYSRGVRKLQAQAELTEKLARHNNREGVEIGLASVKRARALLQKAEERQTTTIEYQRLLACCLRSLAYVYTSSRSFAEATILMDEAIDLFKSIDDIRALIKCHDFRHMLLRDQDLFNEALVELETSVELGRSINYRAHEPLVHAARGGLYRLMQRQSDAVTAIDQGLTLARDLDDRLAEIIILGGLAAVKADIGLIAEALELYRHAIALQRKYQLLGVWNQIAQLNYCAILCYLKGELPEAIELFNEAVEILRVAGLERAEALMLATKARLHTSRAEYIEALTCLSRAAELYEKVKHTNGLAWSLALSGAVYDCAGELTAAQEYFNRSCELLGRGVRESGNAANVTTSVIVLAQHHSDCLDARHFMPQFEERVASLKPSEADTLSTQNLLTLQAHAHLLEHDGQLERAQARYQEILQHSRTLKLQYFECHILFYLARLLNNQGVHAAAWVHCVTSLQIARELRIRGLELRLLKLSLCCCRNLPDRLGELEHLQQEYDRVAAEVLPRETILTLELEHQKSLGQRRQLRYQELQTEYEAIKKERAAGQRLLETKDAHIQHLSDLIKQTSTALSHDPSESDTAYRLRAENLGRQLTEQHAAGEWTAFEQDVHRQDEDFLARLARAYPNLTATERKVCALMRMDYTTKDLSQLLNIRPRSVQAYRHRIRKKLKISSDADLNAYILEMLYPPA